MKFGMRNIWLGNEESLNNIMKLNSFLESPTKDAKAFFGFDDDEEDDEPRFSGMGAHLIQVEDSVAIIRISGSLTNRYSPWNKYFSVISYDEIRDALVSVAGDEGISSILMEIDTGGGAAHGLNEVSDIVTKIDHIKPVEAHTSMYTFSAGMWLASAARKITASPMSEVGSIGVIITMTSYHEMLKARGIEVKTIRAGKYKALGNPSEPISDAAVAIAEEKADKIYGYFLDQMVKTRPQLSIGNKDAWAEGKTFFADEARPLGLIDEIEGFDKVVANLASNYDNTQTVAQYSAAAQPNPTNLDNGDDMGNKKTVLSAEALAALASGATVPTQDAPATDPEPKAAASADPDPKPADPKPAATDPEPKPEANTSTTMDLSAFMGQLTELTGEVATLKAEAMAKDTEITNLKADAAALRPIACQAVNHLQTALGQGTTDIANLDASGIANMHANLRSTFEASVSIGGPISQRMSEDRDTAPNVNDGFCKIHKPTSK